MTEAERKERNEKRFLLLLSALVLACFCIYVTPENYRDSVRTFGMEKIDSSMSHIHSMRAKTSSFFQNVFSLNFIHAAAFSGGRRAMTKKTDKTDHIEIFVIVQPENTKDKEGF